MPKDSRPSRYDVLFEPVRIGPKLAKNRFFQVPHCNGGGYRDPSAVVEMRRTKAEGGWGVIFTEQTEIHHTSEITPFIEQRLWDDRDIPALARMAEAMKSHGALAGIQMAYSGINGPNLYSREVPRAVSPGPILTFTADPVQARALDREGIRDLRRWYRNAFRRAQDAGFDIVCLYGAHGFGILQHFLSRATNQRSDEYGGSLENRARFVTEMIDEAREETKGEMAISIRMSLHEDGPLGFSNREVREFIEMKADLPDLWDLAQGTWDACSGTSRFKDEGAQEALVRGIKALTSKPVVGVGRFTSPDAMVRQVREGVLDFIGAARPSIADPFLPQKIEQGRFEDIRECIGCNICVSGDMTGAISRCTQNPTFMEEWRKGWHPERVAPRGKSERVLIVGGGPAGLEAALVLGKRETDAGDEYAIASESVIRSLWRRSPRIRRGGLRPCYLATGQRWAATKPMMAAAACPATAPTRSPPMPWAMVPASASILACILPMPASMRARVSCRCSAVVSSRATRSASSVSSARDVARRTVRPSGAMGGSSSNRDVGEDVSFIVLPICAGAITTRSR